MRLPSRDFVKADLEQRFRCREVRYRSKCATLTVGLSVFVLQWQRSGSVTRALVAESVQHAARECGLAGTEVTGERNNIAALRLFCVFCAECFGLLG